jgi:hypothetical protein
MVQLDVAQQISLFHNFEEMCAEKKEEKNSSKMLTTKFE